MVLCTHVKESMSDIEPKSKVCNECVKDGTKWTDLRICLTCGYVGCSDQSPNRHATRHFQSTDHPVVSDFPERKWRWCYMDNEYV
ncbi:MAG: UBP-type zinc finger domain-containing protein [Candidatus Micrarchaeales archaeon]